MNLFNSSAFGGEVGFLDDTIATAANKKFNLKNKNAVKLALRITGIPHFGTRLRAFYLGKLLGDGKGKTALDAGCGIGLNSFLAARKGYEVTGVDNDKVKVKTAQKILEKIKYPNINFMLDDITNLKFKSKSFDTVICLEVLEHIENDEKALSEISRVLKKDGHLYMSVPGIGFLSRINQHDKHHVREGYSIDNLSTKFKNSGLKIEKIVKLQHTPLGLSIGILNSEIQKKSLFLSTILFPVFYPLALFDGMLYDIITPHNWIVSAKKI